MMTYLKKLLFLLSILIFLPLAANAASYSLVSGASCGSGSTCPVCSGGGGTWSVSGANFTCSGSISLASGDTVSISASGSITANASIALNNNTIGSATRTINLISNSNTITTTGSSSVFGSITANSGTISLTGGNITGSVFSACCAITTNGTVIGGSVTSNSGTISITGGSVGGSVTTGCCTITANNTIISGSISANTNITLTNSTIGSSSSPVSVTSSNGSITLNTSTNAYGTLTAPSWSTVYVNSGSTVSGTCIPNSTPANACNSSPVLLGSWRMDELSWNGTAAEVKDSSGSGNHGRARVAVVGNSNPSTTSGTPAYTAGSKSTCRYGAFDGTGSPARTYNYVELSGFPTLPNGFTFAAWIRSTNASAQHQRILVRDDAQNGWGLSLADGTGQPKLRFFARNITNNGVVTGQGSNPSCGVFCIDTNSVLTSNAWYYVASVVDTSAKTITLYVYNASGVLQAKTTGAYSGTWTDGTGTAAIGGETSASDEGTQTSWHFLGNIDEVNIYSGALTQASIENLLPSVRTCPAPDHYELVISANSLACMGADVTVRVCADSLSPCNNIDYTVNSNVILTTDAGSLTTTTLLLVSGSATTKLLYPAAIDGANATVTLSGEATVATHARKCCTGTSCSTANSCTTSFKQAGFIFSATATGATSPISTQVAGTASSSTYLRALQTNTATGACTARFTSPQTVKMAYKCVNPATCISGQTFAVGSTANIQSNANEASPIVYSNVSLAFDVNGSAPIPITYSDVGQIELLASLFLPAANGNPDYTLTGSTSFVVKPHSVQISKVTTVADVNNPGGTSEPGAANNFVSAGTPFKVSVQALNQGGAVTPNFGKETPSQSQFITLVTNSLVFPDPTKGTATELTYTPNAFTAASAGTYSNPTVIWPQVGSMTIKSGLGDYLYAGSVTGAVSSTIGRFYPDHYRVVPASTTVTNGCGNFSYMGQPHLQIKPYITAHSAGASGVIVSNYDNPTLGYGGSRGLAVPVYAAENIGNTANLSSRLQNVSSGKWIKGVYSDTLTGTFTRQVSGAPEAPYASLRIGASAMTDLSSTPFDLVGILTNTPSTAAKDMLEGSAIAFKDPSDATKNLLNLRYGRLRLDDAFGPETVVLPVNFVTEYWTGNYFSLNTSDSCTMIPRSAITYPNGTLVTDTNRNVSVGGGTSQGNYTGLFGLGVQFSAGLPGVPDVTTRLSHYFTAPNAPGRFQVGVNLMDLPWLRFDWNQDGNYSDVSLPNANIEFGSYRGNDRVIYWRERLQ